MIWENRVDQVRPIVIWTDKCRSGIGVVLSMVTLYKQKAKGLAACDDCMAIFGTDTCMHSKLFQTKGLAADCVKCSNSLPRSRAAEGLKGFAYRQIVLS